MKTGRFKWLGLMVLSFATLLVISGCGGGGSSTAKEAPPAKISGAVSFPSTTLNLNTLVAKRAGAMVNATGVKVSVYDLSGKLVTEVTPKYDDTAAEDKRIYEYAFTDLKPGVDYVIKASKGSVVLKKLIESKDVTGNVVGQSINSVTTAAVIVASQKLGVVLGDVLPAGTTVAGLSTKINTEIKPVLLEGTIDAVVTGGKTGVDDANKAAFANVYNIVVTAGSEDKDPSKMFTAAPDVLTNTVPILTVDAGTATVAQTAIVKDTITTSAAPTYTAPTESAKVYTDLAKNYLSKQDIANAALNYEKALAVNSDDAEANFGGAITSGMMLMEDPDVQAIINKWGAVVPAVNQVVQGTSPIKLPFGNLTSIKLSPKTVAKTVGSPTTASSTQNVLTAFAALKSKLPQQRTGFKSLAKTLNLVPATAPSISEMQTLIDNVIIPRIDKITARLAKAETATFSFTITKAMQGNPLNGTDETLDVGELYTLDAALNIFQVLFKIASSYNFDIPSQYNYDTIGRDPLAMINSPSFLTLKSGGAAKMAGALDNAKAAAAKAELAYNKIKPRLPGVGMFDLSGWTAIDKADFEADLPRVKAALAGQYDLLDDLGVKVMTINATKFFTNPLTRLNLPTFRYDVPRDATLSVKYDSAVAAERQHTHQIWNGTAYVDATSTYPIYSELVPASDLPDYTLNGILPGNTAANNVAEFNGILPVIDGKLLTGSVSDVHWNFTTDGTYVYYVSIDRQSGGQTIKKIDPATGAVTTVASGNGLYGQLIWYTGKLHEVDYSSISPVTINGSAFTVGAPVASLPVVSGSGDISAVVASGTDIYYAINKWTYPYSTEIHKFSNSTTTDTTLVTTDDYVDSLALHNGYLYTGSEKRNPNASYAVVARYANSDASIMLGGYFYDIYDGKLIKYAGKPAGGTAKAALAKYFGF